MAFVPLDGSKMKAYRNTGTAAIPTWLEVAEIDGVNINGTELKTADLERRGSTHVKKLAGNFEAMTIAFKLIHGLDADNFDAILAAYQAQTPEEWLFINGDEGTAGNQGWRIPCLITDFPWDQSAGTASGHDVKLEEAYMEDPAGTELDVSWLIAV